MSIFDTDDDDTATGGWLGSVLGRNSATDGWLGSALPRSKSGGLLRIPSPDPPRDVARFAWSGAQALAPNLLSLLRGDAPPPYRHADGSPVVVGPDAQLAPNAGSKVPSTEDPRVLPATSEAFDALSTFMPIGAGTKLAMAVPMAAKRIARTALPMDTASRVTRMIEMGFDPELRLYHGTNRAFNSFDLSKAGTMTGVAPARLGIWTSPEPKMAADFATMAHKKMGGAPQVYPLVHRTNKRGSWTLRGDESNLEVASTLAQAWDDGFDAVMLLNATSPSGRKGSIVVIKDPAQLRSPFAQFDPKKRNSANLLAGGAGATVMGPLFADSFGEPQ